MKRARSPLAPSELHGAHALLTTTDVAQLLRVHPKHIYRLLRRGLPGHRVGGEWRFLADEVRAWSGTTRSEAQLKSENPSTSVATPSPECRAQLVPLVAANGDVAVECLLGRMNASGGNSLFGIVQADRGQGLDLLKRGDVLAAGCHGSEIPGMLADERLAFVHLVDRQVGLAVRRGTRIRSLRQIGRWKLASRPPTAGVRAHFDEELRRQGVDPSAVHSGAVLLPSHREVVCTVARGEVDLGLASQAWAGKVGLECLPLCREDYGLLVRASLLGDPRIVRLCEVAQSSAFKREIAAVPGYDARLTGVIAFRPSEKNTS